MSQYGNTNQSHGIFSHGKLQISNNKRYIVHEDGTLFFYLGDTAWELFHRLNREDAEIYLENRKQKQFTVIQAVVLSEMDGLHTPNMFGDYPLFDDDPLKPNETYFCYIDEVIRLAAQKGLYIGLLPTWGDKLQLLGHGIGPVIFTPENAYLYGKWIGSRYKDSPNIIWINGGDREGGGNNYSIWDALAKGIKESDTNHLMTFHPLGGGGGHSSSEWFHRSDWLDFNLAQSGHEYRNLPNYRIIENDYVLLPTKPCMDGEPRYEDHAVNWKPEELGWFDDYDVRQAAWWALLAGACGHTYGCHGIWQFYTPERVPIGHNRHYWYDVIDLPGSFQMAHVRKLLESRPWLYRIPDQFVLRHPGEGIEHQQAARGEQYIIVYLPVGGECNLNLDSLDGKELRSAWYDPRTGEFVSSEQVTNRGWQRFMAPSSGRDNDWVLVIDDERYEYKHSF